MGVRQIEFIKKYNPNVSEIQCSMIETVGYVIEENLFKDHGQWFQTFDFEVIVFFKIQLVVFSYYAFNRINNYKLN